MINKNYRYLNHRYPITIESYTKSDNTLSITFGDNGNGSFNAEFEFYNNGIIKVRLFKDKFTANDYNFVNDNALGDTDTIKIDDNGNKIIASMEGCHAEFTKNPFGFEIISADSKVIYHEQVNDVNPVGDGFDRIFPMGYTIGEDGSIAGMNIAAKLRQDEHVYGLGERFAELDKRGQRVTMMNDDTLGCRDEDSYKNIPFYVSTYGYGLFLHTDKISEFNIGSESLSTVSIHVPDDNLEYYIVTGENVKDIVGRYMDLTGPAVLPPKWSFGLWYSTGFKDNSRKKVEEDAKRIRDEKIPCDVMHFDCYWLEDDMWCDFIWNDELYPNRVEMIENLHRDGYKVCLWINSYVTIKTKMFKEGAEKGYLIKKADGTPYTADLWHGLLSDCGIVDFTNPDAVEWYKEKVKAVLLEGVDVVKTDFGEDIPIDGVFFNGKTGEEMHNIYARLYNQAVTEVSTEVKGEGNALVWARSGYTGMQKFPVCWSGDPNSSYEGMAETLRGGLSIAMSGVPFWSHDMGGFYGEVSEDVFVRWSQFGLFSSHSRLHGTTTRQPWAYGERALKIVGDFARLRYSLMDYIWKIANDCVENNKTFIRPMVMENSNDPTVYSISDQYYFGDDIIVAPVFGGDNAIRNVYLPNGEWVDMLTGKIYQGKQWHSIKCPLEYMPIFIRSGADLLISKDEIQYIALQ